MRPESSLRPAPLSAAWPRNCARNALSKAVRSAISLASSDRLRAVRIVKAEDLGLREDVRSPQARGMARVPLDLGRAPLEGGDDRAAPIARQRKCGRVVLGDSGKQPLRQVDIGKLFRRILPDDLLVRLLATRRKRSDTAGDQLQGCAAREFLRAHEREPAHLWHTEQSVRCAVSMW